MRLFLIVALSLAVFVGCKTSYDVTFSNGSKITGVSKPVLDNTTGQYRFKMADGREVKVPAGRIRTIAPHGESSGPQFISPTPKK